MARSNKTPTPITDEARAILSGKIKANGQLPIAPPELLKEIEEYMRRYLILPKIAYLPIALWAMATHAVQVFDCFPYIAVVSAVKRCGKTRLAEVLETLVRLPWRGTAPSPAALYRMLGNAGTLLLDETEPLNGKNKSEKTQDLLAVLNQGYRKGGTVPRCEGPKLALRLFPVYGPKLFAAIGRLPDTLMDRSIVVHMKRRAKNQKVGRFMQKLARAEAQPLHDNLVRFAQSHRAKIDQAYEQTLRNNMDLEFLNDRDAELWIPLFTICSLVNPERMGDLRTAAAVMAGGKTEDDVDDSYSLTLLRDIRTVWPEGTEKYETALLIERLKALEESPWSEHQLNPRKLARMLRPFEVKPGTIRIGDKTPKGYYYAELKEAFSLYIDDLSATVATS